tara:strand:+ start:748 stop:867 length:120 start_codon:yes stop_codon:yes gene_type:complete
MALSKQDAAQSAKEEIESLQRHDRKCRDKVAKKKNDKKK